jgi:hypothetical protein
LLHFWGLQIIRHWNGIDLQRETFVQNILNRKTMEYPRYLLLPFGIWRLKVGAAKVWSAKINTASAENRSKMIQHHCAQRHRDGLASEPGVGCGPLHSDQACCWKNKVVYGAVSIVRRQRTSISGFVALSRRCLVQNHSLPAFPLSPAQLVLLLLSAA